jgi:hypothetical protein
MSVPRFVVLEHDSPRGRHWDLMLETGPVLATWALVEPPDSHGAIPCEALPDHRPRYLDYEGPISGDRGSVTRWDQGTCAFIERSETRLVVLLVGDRLSGRATLARAADASSGWRFSYVAT